MRDTDARLGEILDAVERAGVFDDTAFVLVADHGMEETDPACRGDWDVALRDAGVDCPRRGLHVDLHRRHLIGRCTGFGYGSGRPRANPVTKTL